MVRRVINDTCIMIPGMVQEILYEVWITSVAGELPGDNSSMEEFYRLTMHVSWQMH